MVLPGQRREAALDRHVHLCLRFQVQHHQPERAGAQQLVGGPRRGEGVGNADYRQGVEIDAPLHQVRREEDRVAEADPRRGPLRAAGPGGSGRPRP